MLITLQIFKRKNINYLFIYFRFQDSMDHFSSSLDAMANLLNESKHSFSILRKSSLLCYEKNRSEKLKLEKLLLRKGIFPYSFATSEERLIKTKEIPSIKEFEDTLNQKQISKKEHNRAKKMFRELKCKNMLDYFKKYCLLDTVLLGKNLIIKIFI